MNIYEKVEKFINSSQNRPIWVDEILFELREIKRLLKEEKNKKEFYTFVSKLKQRFKDSLVEGREIKISFKQRYYKVDMKGFICEIKSSETLDKKKAFEIFRFLYENKENLDKYIEEF